MTTTEPLILTERIRATPDQVFDFLVDPDKLLRWMGTDAKIDPTPGGQFWLNVTGEHIASGTYVTVERPNTVSFTWGWEGQTEVPPGSTTVTISLASDGDDTIVELRHDGLPFGPEDEHKGGWTYFLGRLVTAGEGGDPGAVDMSGGDS